MQYHDHASPYSKMPASLPAMPSSRSFGKKKAKTLSSGQDSSKHNLVASLSQNRLPDELIEAKPQAKVKYDSPSRNVKVAASSLAVLSSYANGCLNGAQLYAGLPIFLGMSVESISLPLRMLALPLIPFINSTALYYHANLKTLNNPNASAIHLLWRKFKKQPLDCSIILLAAITSGLIVTNTSKKLFAGLSDGPSAELLPVILGLADTTQYLFLEGNELIKRVKKGFFYQNKAFTQSLQSYSKLKRYSVYCGVLSIPIIGALLNTALAFSETRELAITMNPSHDKDYQTAIGNFIGGPLSIIYGVMQAALYGYLSQKIIIDRFWPMEVHQSPPKSCFRVSLTLLAAGGAFLQAFTMMTAAAQFQEDMTGALPDTTGLITIAAIAGTVGLLQNFWVEGKELISLGDDHPHAPEPEEAKVFHISHRSTLHEVIVDVARVALLTLARTMMQSYLVPDAETADEVNTNITVASYSFSSLASIVAWLGFHEIPRLLRMKPGYFHLNLFSQEVSEKIKQSSSQTLPMTRSESKQNFKKKSESKEDLGYVTVQGHRSDSPISSKYSVAPSDAPPLGLKNNSEENQLYANMEARAYFYRSVWRLASQASLQLFLPVLIGSVLELELRTFFDDYTEQDAESSLNNAQLMGSFITGLISINISGFMDRRWRQHSENQLLGSSAEIETKNGRSGDLSASRLNKVDAKNREIRSYSLEKMHDLLSLLSRTHNNDSIEIFEFILCFDEYSATSSQSRSHSKANSRRPSDVLKTPLMASSNSNEDKADNPEEKKRCSSLQEAKAGPELLAGALSHHQVDQQDRNNQSKCYLFNPQEEKKKRLDPLKEIEKRMDRMKETHKTLLIPICYKALESSDLGHDFAFLHLSYHEFSYALIMYSPTNNTYLEYLLINTFVPNLKDVNLITPYTHTPLSRVHSGPWVIEQLRTFLLQYNRTLDLELNFKLSRHLDVIAVRAEHAKSLVQMAAQNGPTDLHEDRPRVNPCTAFTQGLLSCWGRLFQGAPPALFSEDQPVVTARNNLR